MHNMKEQAADPRTSLIMKMKRTQIAGPQSFHIPIDRRRFFKSMAVVSAGFTLPGYLA